MYVAKFDYKDCADCLLIVAIEEKDPLAIQIFHNAGVQLGKHVRALIPKADKV